MICKVVVDGESAVISTHPREAPSLRIVVPASRLRSRFPRGHADPCVGFFAADVFDGLDVLEVGDRIPPPRNRW